MSLKNMNGSCEGEVGCMERMKIRFPPADRWIYFNEERYIFFHLSRNLSNCSDSAGGSKQVSEREARSHDSHSLIVWCFVSEVLTLGLLLNCTPKSFSLISGPGSVFCVFHRVGGGQSHVVGHVDGVQLVCQEGVSQVHPLLLSPGVDGNHPGVHDDHHPDDEVVLLQDYVGDEGHQVQGLLLRAAQLRHHHQQVGPRKHGTEEG